MNDCFYLYMEKENTALGATVGCSDSKTCPLPLTKAGPELAKTLGVLEAYTLSICSPSLSVHPPPPLGILAGTLLLRYNNTSSLADTLTGLAFLLRFLPSYSLPLSPSSISTVTRRNMSTCTFSYTCAKTGQQEGSTRKLVVTPWQHFAPSGWRLRLQ